MGATHGFCNVLTLINEPVQVVQWLQDMSPGLLSRLSACHEVEKLCDTPTGQHRDVHGALDPRQVVP